MSADELRARFSELAEPVVPMEDPHGRLMARRRKRLRARLASLATVTAAVVAGGIAAPTTMFAFGTRPELPPEVTVPPSKTVTAEEYVNRLANAPIRGNLSADKEKVAEVQRAFSELKPMVDGATDPRLVFLNKTDRMLQAVVIYAGGERAVAVSRGATLDASPKDLLSEKASYSAPLSPFLVIPVSDSFGKMRGVVGLAPPGCGIEASAKGGFTADGAWVRTYEPEPTTDYVMREGPTVNELWRVSCDGKVREVRPADPYLDSVDAEGNPPLMYERLLRYSGLTSSKGGVVKWRGHVPGFKSELTLVAPSSVPGPAMLAVGSFAKTVLATDLLEPERRMILPSPSPAQTHGGEWPMLALGVAAEGITAVRMPEPAGDRTVLGDRVLVYTDTDAAMVEALDHTRRLIASEPLSRGVAILTFNPGSAAEIRTLSSGGRPLSMLHFTELAAGSRVLGDQLIKDW